MSFVNDEPSKILFTPWLGVYSQPPGTLRRMRDSAVHRWMRMMDYAYTQDSKEEDKRSNTANTASEYTDYEYERSRGPEQVTADFMQAIDDVKSKMENITDGDKTKMVVAIDELRSSLLSSRYVVELLGKWTPTTPENERNRAAEFIQTMQDLDISKIGPYDRTAIVHAMDTLRKRLLLP